MHITWDEQTGDVNVNGPINNKGLCYLMLECARDAVKDHVDKQTKSTLTTNGLDTFIKPIVKRKR